MKLVLMCGGIGERMSPIKKDKSLLSFSGKPLILHQLATAQAAGLNDAIIIANPDNVENIKSLVAELRDMTIDFVVQESALGMADALLSASPSIKESPFLLVSSNDIFEGSLYTALLDRTKTDKDTHTAFIAALQVHSYFPGGYLVTDKEDNLLHIVEKPAPGEEPSDLINIVVHLHNKPQLLFDYLSKTRSTSDDVYEKAIDMMIKDGCQYQAVRYQGSWQSIKYPWHILDAMDYFFTSIETSIAGTCHIAGNASIDGKVIIEDNVRILEGAVVRGPAYIGANSIIGNGALVRDSSIGSGTVVGYGTEIKHSHIGENCWFHTNYIGDSVIDNNCSFGSGAVTANYRLDEEDIAVWVGKNRISIGHDKLGVLAGEGCRIGINASLMPGVRLGTNAFVGAHVCLTKDLDSDKMAFEKSDYVVMPNRFKLNRDKRQELIKKLRK